VHLDTSAAVRDAVKAAVGVLRHRSLRVPGPWDMQIDGDGRVRVTIRSHAAPVAASYQVVLRTEHGEWPLGTVLFRAREWGVRSVLGHVPALRGADVKSAAIILRPDSSAARATVDVVSIYGGELAFRDLIVQHVDDVAEELRQPTVRPRRLTPPAPATRRARPTASRSAATSCPVARAEPAPASRICPVRTSSYGPTRAPRESRSTSPRLHAASCLCAALWPAEHT
jgi:hypothetical protein